eukprot:6168118-Heterocapsa_arctica.AAC.1
MLLKGHSCRSWKAGTIHSVTLPWGCRRMFSASGASSVGAQQQHLPARSAAPSMAGQGPPS